MVSRGACRQSIFHDDRDRRRFLSLLADVVEEMHWSCLTYCLMGNHFHLVIRLQQGGLSDGMQRLNGAYGRWFNDRHERSGHVFERRFWSKLVRRQAHLLALARYVALNPVAAGLVLDPGDWPWSAHRALVGQAYDALVDVSSALAYFDDDLERARLSYRSLVAQHDATDAAALDVGLLDPRDRLAHDLRVVRAHLDLGRSVGEIADAMGRSRRTIQRRVSAKGV